MKQINPLEVDFSNAPRYRKSAFLRLDQIQYVFEPLVVYTKHSGELETSQIAQPGDIVVTRAHRDSYVITSEKFEKLYYFDSVDCTLRSKNIGRAIRMDEDFCIEAPWGEMQYIKAGGVLFKSETGNEVYGNQGYSFDVDFELI
jgi:hypothetical protein